MTSTRKHGVLRVLICGASAVTEAGEIASVGDEALAEHLAGALAARLPGADVRYTLHGVQDARHAGRARSDSLWSLWREIGSADLVILGGGTLFQEDREHSWRRPLCGLIRYVLAVAILTRLRGKRFVVFGVGAENVSFPTARVACRLTLRLAAHVAARDAASAALLAELGAKGVEVGGDAMFVEPLVRFNSAESNTICVSLRDDATDAVIAGISAWLCATPRSDMTVVLVAMDRQGGDAAALQRLARSVGEDRCEWIPPTATWQEVLRVMAASRACVGMRLHFAIFAVIAERPLSIVSASPKSQSFGWDIGISAVPLTAAAGEVTGALYAIHAGSRDAVTAMSERTTAAFGRSLEAGLR